MYELKPTEQEQGWLAIMRLNKAEKRVEIDKKLTLGPVLVRFHWRSKKSLWGRFGGGWNWKLGVQWGSTTAIFSLLVCDLTIKFNSRKVIDRKIIEQLEQVRADGLANMGDRYAVQRMANKLGLHDLAVWIEDNLKNRGLYMTALAAMSEQRKEK